MSLIVITAPTSEPVSVADAKLSPSFRVSVATDDTPIGALITAARELGEAITKRAFMPTTFEYVLDEFPFGLRGYLRRYEIVLPCPPLVSVTSIKYIDANGTEQTLSPSVYTVLTYPDVSGQSEPGKVFLASGQSWPSIKDVPDAVRIRYVAGYATAAAVPGPIKTWITMRAGTMYDNPQAIVVGATVEKIQRDFIDGLLDPYRVISF
jgi:uncharacterized phiE125 gp8 family phage protein